MKLSICVVNWEGGEVFEKCLKSIEKECKFSKISDYEIIVVDNHSHHLNRKMLKDVERLKLYVNKKNLLFSEGTNQSIKHSAGDYILILNNDIILKKGFISSLLNNIKKHDAIVPKLILPDGSTQKSMPYIPTIKEILLSSLGFSTLFPKFDMWPSDNTDYKKSKIVSTRNQPAFSALLLKTKTWKTVGKLDTNLPLLWNDTDWFYRFHSKKLSCLYYPKAVALHHHGLSVNKNRYRKILYSTKSMEYFLVKAYNPRPIVKVMIKLTCFATYIERILREFIVLLNSRSFTRNNA